MDAERKWRLGDTWTVYDYARGDSSAACLHQYVLETMVQAVVEPQRFGAGSAGGQKWRKKAISNTRVEGGASGCGDRVYQLRDV